jgi:hypothetical protein
MIYSALHFLCYSYSSELAEYIYVFVSHYYNIINEKKKLKSGPILKRHLVKRI